MTPEEFFKRHPSLETHDIEFIDEGFSWHEIAESQVDKAILKALLDDPAYRDEELRYVIQRLLIEDDDVPRVSKKGRFPLHSLEEGDVE